MSEDTEAALYEVKRELTELRQLFEQQFEIVNDDYVDRDKRRDLFAAAALTGIMANPKSNPVEDDQLAQVCFDVAEHMLNASERARDKDEAAQLKKEN